MRILYDYQAFKMQTHGGVSRCFLEIIKNLPVEAKPIIGVRSTSNIHLQEYFKELNGNICNITPKSNFMKTLANNVRIPFKDDFKKMISSFDDNKRCSINFLKEQNFDIFHATYHDPYFLKYIGNKPFVITIHDMINEIYPQYFKNSSVESSHKRILAEKANAIIAVSENTKKDIISLWNIPEHKIHVVYHGTTFYNGTIHPVLNEPYLLFIGGRGGKYKNFIKLLRTIARLLICNNIKLVCTSSDFNLDELRIIEELGLNNNIVHIYADDETLFSLYKYAIAYIAPSEYEGFGLPILEAMSVGCPVALNNASCYPEIGGKNAFYFNIDDKDNTINVLDTLINLSHDEKKAISLAEIAYSKKFSWKRSAKQLFDVYNSILI